MSNDTKCRVYTLRATFGQQSGWFPSYIASQRKADLQSMMRECGFTEKETAGTKSQLLEKIRTMKPNVTYKIDSRECLQRILVVVLDAWQYSPEHTFTVSMPRRGDHPLGTCRIDELEWMNFYNFSTNDDVDFSASRETESFVRAQVVCGADEDTVRGLLSEDISVTDLAPYRVVEGRASTFENIYESALDRMQERSEQTVGQRTDMIQAMTLMDGGALSLEEVALKVGDVMKFRYRREHTICIEVVAIEEGADCLPEVACDEDLRDMLAGKECVGTQGTGNDKISVDKTGGVKENKAELNPLTDALLGILPDNDIVQLQEARLSGMQRAYMTRAAVINVSDIKPPRLPELKY